MNLNCSSSQAYITLRYHFKWLTHLYQIETVSLSVYEVRNVGRCVSPDTFMEIQSLLCPVSFYAIFKWWLLPSLHPGWIESYFLFTLTHHLGTLVHDLGCFPLDHEPSRPQSVCSINSLPFGVWKWSVRLSAPITPPELYAAITDTRMHLHPRVQKNTYMFGEPWRTRNKMFDGNTWFTH